MRMVLKFILNGVGQGLHIPDVNRHPPRVVHMIQCKEQWCEFLQEFHIQREILLSVSPDEDENEGFISHDQVPVHERRTILLHVVSPSFDRFFIVGANSKHESFLPELMQGQESDLVGMSGTS